MLVRVVSPYFVAGLVFDDAEVCIEAAPILRWCLGQQRSVLRAIFCRRGLVATVLR